MRIANVALTNTFDTWRIRSNQVFNRMNQFAVTESSLYANTLTANVRFVSIGSTKLGTTASNRTIVNGLLSANGNLNITANTTANRINVTNILSVSGNTSVNRLNASGNTTVNRLTTGNTTFQGNTITIAGSVLNIDTGLLFLQKNANRVGVNTLNPNTAFHVNGVVFANSGFRFPDGATTTAPLYVYDSSGTQLYP